MARNQMPIPTEEPRFDLEGASDGELAPSPAWRRRGLVGLAAAAGAVGALAMWASAGGGHAARAAPTPKPMTVRRLLESDALAELATDNMIAMGGVRRADGAKMERRELKGQVSESFKNISTFIAAEDPFVARQLEELEVSDEQQSAAMMRLHHYSNPVLMKIASEITAAYEKHHAMHQDIADRVLAHTEDLKAVAEAMFPVHRGDTAEAPAVSRRLATPRRLESLHGVAPQARTLLEGLEVDLGDRMPKAPSRMLFDLTSSPSAAPSATSASHPQTQGFMDCLMAAVPNPIEVCTCISNNMSHVVSMMMDFGKNALPGSN